MSQQLFGHGTGPVVLSRLNCNGNERDLFQCQHFGYYFLATHINNDVGVRCQLKFDGKFIDNVLLLEYQCGHVC